MSNLVEKIHQDQQLYSSLLARKGKEFRLEIPVIGELYTHLIDNVSKYQISNINDIPIFDSNSLKEGVYKTSEKIIVVIDVVKGSLKYHTFFATKHFRESKVADLIGGKYIVSFCFDSTKQNHLIPEGFTYLVLDIEKSDVIPFHAIESSLPSDLSVYWVFFAMKHLRDEFFCSIDITKSMDEKEKNTLEEKGYLD